MKELMVVPVDILKWMRAVAVVSVAIKHLIVVVALITLW